MKVRLFACSECCYLGGEEGDVRQHIRDTHPKKLTVGFYIKEVEQ